jgi:putative hydrolase of the HAD superfamily
VASPDSDFGVLFDIDDTLVDFSGAARAALLDVAASFQESAGSRSGSGGRAAADVRDRVLHCWELVSEREYGRFLAGELTFDEMLVVRMTAVVREMDPAGVLGLDPAELELLRNQSIFTHYRPYEDVPPVLGRFRAAGVAIGVMSNSDGAYQRRKMVAAGLDGLLERAVFSGDLGVSKPHPAIFAAGAAALGLPADRVVYVGDRWATDVVGALRSGLSAVWLNRPGLPRPAGAADDLDEVPRAGERLAELAGLQALDAAFARSLLTH